MFSGKKKQEKGDYSKVSLSDFSDDDYSSDEELGGRPANGNGVDNSMQRQQQLMQRQDEGLEMLSQSAVRLGDLSMAINDELTQQNQMMDEMDTDLEQAGENLDFVTRKTKEFIAKSGGTKNCIIIVTLSVIVIILILLIFYT